MQGSASAQQARAAANARLQEVSRQTSIMQDNMAIQAQQRQDALQSRRAFQDQTLAAYTPDKLAADRAANQAPLTAALTAAGDRGITPLSADATRSTGAVQVGGYSSGQDSQAAGSSAYDAALASQLARAGGINQQQAQAQAAMQALGQARIAGNQRLQDSAAAIQLAGARNQALNRPLAANGLLSNASANYYAGQQEQILNSGAGTRLGGQVLGTLGQLGYGAASKGMFRSTSGMNASPGSVNSQDLGGSYLGGG